MPIFMRNAIKLNSVIPNLQHPTVQKNIDAENDKLQQLINSFADVISFLLRMLEKIRIKHLKKK